MKQRVVTAVIALIFFIPVIYIGGTVIDIVAAMLAVVGISEIFMMRKRIIVSFEFVWAILATMTMVLPETAFSDLPKHLNRFDLFFIMVILMLIHTVLTKNKFTFDDAGVLTLSSIYIGVGFRYLAEVRNASNGLALLGYVLVVIWSTDIGAYMIGRKIGKHKLWPAISPNKTWEGSIGAVISAVILTAGYLLLVPVGRDFNTMLLLALLFSIAGQMGDLIESAYKRYYGVKDSGKILPGHGGILDRFDSLLFVLPLVGLFGVI